MYISYLFIYCWGGVMVVLNAIIRAKRHLFKRESKLIFAYEHTTLVPAQILFLFHYNKGTLRITTKKYYR